MPLKGQKMNKATGQFEDVGGVRNIATYRPPGILALFKNSEPVRVTACGDKAGHSPVLQYVDEGGKVNWASQDQFIIIDTDYWMPSKENITETLRALRT